MTTNFCLIKIKHASVNNFLPTNGENIRLEACCAIILGEVHAVLEGTKQLSFPVDAGR